jgi:transcriptional regulator with PAS, ATPase and Fis domain
MMEQKGRTYEREIRLAGFVLMMVLLGANVTLFWLSTRLSRRIQTDHSARLALVAELAYQQLMDRSAKGANQWGDFIRQWGLVSVGIIGPDGIWLVHSDPVLSGRPGSIPGGLDLKRIREMEDKGGVLSDIYQRDGRIIQSFYLARQRGSALVVVEQDAAFNKAIERAIALQTVFMILGSLGALALFARYLQLVLSPFRQMARQAQEALDGRQAVYGSEVDFVLETYRKTLDELRSQGRTLQDLYDGSRLQAERIERINRHLLESLDKGVVFFGDEGKITSANRTALEMLGAEDIGDLSVKLKQAGISSEGSADQTTVELEGGRCLQAIRSRMSSGGPAASENMLLMTDITLARRIEEQMAYGENVRLLRASAEGLIQKVGPELEQVREALEVCGDEAALKKLRKIGQAIEDLGRQLQFSPWREEGWDDEDRLLEQPGMRRVLDMVQKVAPNDSTVLITGESGTGKELVARRIHRWSGRRKGPFVSINCGALPENLIESELFGYVKGAFTGAYRDKAGLLQAADGGTFLLDEVGDLSPALQIKLLRVLQEREIVPLGGIKPRPINIRVIAATNRDLEQMVRENRFRQDLYFRLNIFPIVLPSLRQRLSDIGLLAEILISRICARNNLPMKFMGPESLAVLRSYSWPGNVRELENVLERALVVSQGICITPDDIQLPVPSDSSGDARMAGDLWEISKKAAAEAERQAIWEALEQTGGNKSQAARSLKISYRVMLKKIKDYQLE